jgi:NAD(P)-dependent dehydrogenase (short-subunit alcohol dehydrogenase family)
MANGVDKLMDTLILPGFSRIGYRIRSRDFTPIEADLSGQTAVVTGATSGLGRATAEGLAELGARVVLVARNGEKADRAKHEIVDATGNEDIAIELAELSLMGQVRELARRLLETEPNIDILVNNAGALFPERRLTEEGLDISFATNLLSHFVLTNALIPRMKESAPARIINVSSGGMYSQRISIANLQNDKGEYKGSAAYARTKRGQVILTELWAEKLQGTGVTVHAMHPGWADTPGVSHSLPTFYKLTKPFLRTAGEGADTIVWLAAAEEGGKTTGLFWHDRESRPTHKTKRTKATAEKRQRLWEELAKLS